MDEDLLADAKRAQEHLIEAEHAAEVARAEFHRAVRRLHLGGASLRELAQIFQVSHQRVHQIVEAAGGARRWSRRPGGSGELACSFCGRAQRKTRRLITGPGVYICDKCVAVADTVLVSGRAAGTELGPIRPVQSEASRQRCSFCGKHRGGVSGLATTIDNPVTGKGTSDAAICADCLALCREMHANHLT